MGRRGQGHWKGPGKIFSGAKGMSSIGARFVVVVPMMPFMPVVMFGPMLAVSMSSVLIVVMFAVMASSMMIPVLVHLFMSIFLMIPVGSVVLKIFPISSVSHCRTAEKSCHYGQHNTDFE